MMTPGPQSSPCLLRLAPSPPGSSDQRGGTSMFSSRNRKKCQLVKIYQEDLLVCVSNLRDFNFKI